MAYVYDDTEALEDRAVVCFPRNQVSLGTMLAGQQLQ